MPSLSSADRAKAIKDDPGYAVMYIGAYMSAAADMFALHGWNIRDNPALLASVYNSRGFEKWETLLEQKNPSDLFHLPPDSMPHWVATNQEYLISKVGMSSPTTLVPHGEASHASIGASAPYETMTPNRGDVSVLLELAHEAASSDNHAAGDSHGGAPSQSLDEHDADPVIPGTKTDVHATARDSHYGGFDAAHVDATAQFIHYNTDVGHPIEQPPPVSGDAHVHAEDARVEQKLDPAFAGHHRESTVEIHGHEKLDLAFAGQHPHQEHAVPDIGASTTHSHQKLDLAFAGQHSHQEHAVPDMGASTTHSHQKADGDKLDLGFAGRPLDNIHLDSAKTIDVHKEPLSRDVAPVAAARDTSAHPNANQPHVEQHHTEPQKGPSPSDHTLAEHAQAVQAQVQAEDVHTQAEHAQAVQAQVQAEHVHMQADPSMVDASDAGGRENAFRVARRRGAAVRCCCERVARDIDCCCRRQSCFRLEYA